MLITMTLNIYAPIKQVEYRI